MAEIKDSQGKTTTISDTSLTVQQSAESRTSSVRDPFQTFIAQNVTPPRLSNMLKSAANWGPVRLMEYAQEVEERDGHYRSVLGTRKMAVTGLPWVLTPASEEDKDVQIATFVTESLGGQSFTGLLMDLLDGISKGYSVVEIIWSVTNGTIIPERYVWVDQKNLNFDEETQTKIQLLTEDETEFGIPLQPGKYLTHTPKLKSGKVARSGLIFTVAAMYLVKAYITKDWLAFSEVFGMPLRYAKMTANSTEEERNKVFQALKALSSDATAIFDEAVEVQFLGVNTTAHGNFYERGVGFWNKEISKVTLGQTMSSEDGASLAQAKVHNDVRLDIRDADAKSLADVINNQLIRAIVSFNFGVDVKAPSFSFIIEEPEDLKMLAGVVKTLTGAGLPIGTAYAYEKFGIPQPEVGEPILSVGTSSLMTFAEEDAEASAREDEDVEDLPDGDEEEALSAMAASKLLGIHLTKFYSMAAAAGVKTYRDKKRRRRFPARDVEAIAEARAADSRDGEV